MIAAVPVKEMRVVRERAVCCEIPVVDLTWAEATAHLLKALADPTRLTIVTSLWRPPRAVCICDFTGPLQLSQPTISHHMAKLKDAGLVDSEKKGIWVYYRLRADLPQSSRALLAQLLA